MFAPEAPSLSIFLPKPCAAYQRGPAWEEAQEEEREGTRGQCPLTTQQQAEEDEA